MCGYHIHHDQRRGRRNTISRLYHFAEIYARHDNSMDEILLSIEVRMPHFASHAILLTGNADDGYVACRKEDILTLMPLKAALSRQ